jgi:hypothetical protein
MGNIGLLNELRKSSSKIGKRGMILRLKIQTFFEIVDNRKILSSNLETPK